jgi:hypothetical protein
MVRNSLLEAERTISKESLIRLKPNEHSAYRIARQLGINSNWPSRAINGIEAVRTGVERTSSVGRILGLSPEECVEKLCQSKFPTEDE